MIYIIKEESYNGNERNVCVTTSLKTMLEFLAEIRNESLDDEFEKNNAYTVEVREPGPDDTFSLIFTYGDDDEIICGHDELTENEIKEDFIKRFKKENCGDVSDL